MMTGAAIGKDKDRLWCILQDEKLFYMGGLKALNMTPENVGLAHCMKSSDNGKIKLSYDISDYSALSEEIGRLSVEDIIAVVKSLTQSVMTISNNGMMSLQSTVLEMDKVFISGSRSTGFKTLIIYVPLAVQSSMGGDDGSEHFFRFLHEVLRSAGRASVDPELRPLSAALESNRNSLENFYEQLNRMGGNTRGASNGGGSAGQGGSARGGGNSSSSSNAGSGGSVNPGGGTSQKKNTVYVDNEGTGTKNKMNGKTVAVIVAQICAVALGIISFVLIGPLAVAAVLFVDAIAVVIIFTAGSMRQKKTVQTVEFDPGLLSGSGDTEEFDNFTPSVRLVGQNTPMMLKYNIEKSEFSIGRASDCDAIIPESLKAISGHHCKIITENGTMFVRDDYESGKRVGSKNGTFINGSSNRVEPKQKVRLQINDTLQLANYRFKVEHL